MAIGQAAIVDAAFHNYTKLHILSKSMTDDVDEVLQNQPPEVCDCCFSGIASRRAALPARE
jgi:hypothetical protein